MSTFARIQEFLAQTPVDQPFTTRSLLHLGSRAMIDTTMHRLIKSGEIVRITRGIFVQKSGFERLPPTIEITMTKTYKRRLDVSLATRPPNWKPCEKIIGVAVIHDFTPVQTANDFMHCSP